MDTLIFQGGAVKALGEGRVGGYLIRFDDDGKARDLEGEYFTSKTYFGPDDGNGRDTFFHHTHPIGAEIDGKYVEFTELAERHFAPMKTERRDIGIWAETVLDMADEYERAVYGLAEKNKLGWSSGAAGHTVRYGNRPGEIKQWVIAEGSLTPTPAEPRNRAVSLKSLIGSGDEPEATSPEGAEASGDAAKSDADKEHSNNHIVVGDNAMPENENTQQQEEPQAPQPQGDYKTLEALATKQQKRIDELLDIIESTPNINRSGYVTNDGGTADPNIKNVGDLLISIRRGDTDRMTKHYKLQRESDGPDGGYLVPRQTLMDIGFNAELTSGLMELARRFPVQSPAGDVPIRDYSVSVSGGDGQTATAQGLNSQNRAEGGAYTEETIKFEMLSYNCKTAISGKVPITIEMADDAPMVEALLQMAIGDDARNKEEFHFIQGSGVNQPLGILSWGGAIEVEEATDNTFAIEDADKMVAKLLRGGDTGRYAWVISPSAFANLAAFTRGTATSTLHNIRDSLPMMLHGMPVFESQNMPVQGTTGYVALVNMNAYFIFELGALRIRYSEHRYIDDGKVAWFFDKRYDGMPALTSAVTLQDGTLTKSPVVVLKNKT